LPSDQAVALQQAQKLRDKRFNTIPHEVIQRSLARFGDWNDI
jgi:hypothetical protein